MGKYFLKKRYWRLTESMTIVNYFENEVKSTQDTLSNKIDPLSPIWTDRKRELIYNLWLNSLASYFGKMALDRHR